MSSDPPLPHLVTQNIKDSLYSTRGDPPPMTTPHHSGASSGATAFPIHASVDESFAIDLPPASQLDSSVLEALPSSLREKILRGYSKEVPPTATVFSEPTQDIQKPQTASQHTVVVEDTTLPADHPQPTDCSSIYKLPNPKPRGIRFESDHLPKLRGYIKEWVMSCSEEPKEEGIEKVTEYLIELSRRNIEVLSILLKYFRRLISNSQLVHWYPVFNSLLHKLQTEIRGQYNGTLPITEIQE